MNKRFLNGLTALVIAGFTTAGAFAQVDYSDPKQRNPQNDPDVERGYQEHQKEYEQKQKDQEGESADSNYEVDPGEQPSTHKTQ